MTIRYTVEVIKNENDDFAPVRWNIVDNELGNRISYGFASDHCVDMVVECANDVYMDCFMLNNPLKEEIVVDMAMAA